MTMEVFERIKQRIINLEQRIVDLRQSLEDKDAILAQMQGLPAPTKSASSTRDAKRRDMEESTPSSDPPEKKPNLFPTIGELVENEDEEEAEDLFDETGMKTSELGVTEIQSLCLSCEEQGVTKLLLTKIPYFQDIILMAFECPHCGYKDNQIKPGAPVRDRGQRITLKATNTADLSRQMVKSDSCTIRLEELDFEIPPGRGVITNIEGLLSEAIESLEHGQPLRRAQDGEEVYQQVEDFINKLRDVVSGKTLPVTLTLDDPAGNSFLDNPFAPKRDPNLTEKLYTRSHEQQELLGLQISKEEEVEDDAAKITAAASKTGSTLRDTIKEEVDSSFVNKEILSIPSPCPECMEEGNAETCIVNLPFFKEVIVMAFCCEHCGYRDTEIKGGGAIPKQGKRETLKLESKEDLKRDFIKSDTAQIVIPELELELTRGSLGGMYTTVEGVIEKMKENIFGNNLFQGDSQDKERAEKFQHLENEMDAILRGERQVTLVVADPLANSYIYSPFGNPEEDPRLHVELYDRCWEEDEELGLHDMQVDQVELAENEAEEVAEKVMENVQAGSKKTHPHEFTQGST